MGQRWGMLASILMVLAIGGPVGAVEEKKGMGGQKMEPHAIIKTKFGEMEIRFFRDVAPKHVENFVSLAKSGFYNGTIFHRVIPGFMIQGGDPNTKDPNKKSDYGMGGPPGLRLKAEFNDKPHKRGIVSMARSNHPDSAGSQFFVVVKDSNFLDHQYTAFGEVIKGMEVADQIVSVPREAPGAKDLPLERVEMTVSIVEKPAS
jgi:peptidyl-prolyl cis-trans isomerase B (cyclophilin B)